jgi:hypothetical protein
MWTYADRFFTEAEARDIHLDKSNLTIKFVDKTEIAPYAGYGTINPPLVRMVKEYWDSYTEVQKEILMFHELGHAVLGRQHTNEMLPDCVHYKSMMLNGNQFVVYERVTDQKREYYIDELFNPMVESPWWAGLPKTNKTPAFENVTDGWQFSAIDGSTNTGTKEADNSLHIHGTAGSGDSFWYIPLPSNGLTVGSTITVTLKMKMTNVSDNGGNVTLHPDLTRNPNFWVSMNMYRRLDGTQDWQTIQLTLNCYPTDTPPMFLYLSLVGTASGDIWFKDVSVDYYN